MRFESKHCFFKRCMKSAQNFKNVTQTLSEKHQLLQAYKQSSQYFQNTVEVANSIPLLMDTFHQDIQSAIQMCSVSDSAEVSSEVTVKGTLYKKGHYVALNKCEGGLLFGEIQFIIINSNTQVYFLVQEFKSQFSDKLHVYTLVHKSSFKCVEYSSLLDYYPLSAYKRGTTSLIPLKHAVSS